MRTEIVGGRRVWTEEAIGGLGEVLLPQSKSFWTDGRSFLYYGLLSSYMKLEKIPGMLDSHRSTSLCGLLKVTLYPDNFEIWVEGVGEVSYPYTKENILDFWELVRAHWQLRESPCDL